jgi:hypothetical protein
MSFKKQSKNILNIDMLTVTPSMLEVYGYELKGGKDYQANSRDVKKLTKLLEDSDITQHNETTELSSEIFMGSENETEEKKSSSSSSISSSSSTNVSDSSSSESELKELSDLTEDAEKPKHHKETSEEHHKETSAEHTESELKGGADKSSKSKKKHHRKHFFDDSDLDLNSTTDSILSSLTSSDC